MRIVQNLVRRPYPLPQSRTYLRRCFPVTFLGFASLGQRVQRLTYGGNNPSPGLHEVVERLVDYVQMPRIGAVLMDVFQLKLEIGDVQLDAFDFLKSGLELEHSLSMRNTRSGTRRGAIRLRRLT